jgi:uncharacterized protein
MNSHIDRALRFLHPDLDAPEMEAGLQITPAGGMAVASGAEAVRQSILILLSTIPGERVMRPDYGCNLHRLVFAPNDNTSAGLAIHYVRQAIERWEPRASIVRLDARRNEEAPERMDIILVYRVRTSGQTDSMTLTLDLMAGN